MAARTALLSFRVPPPAVKNPVERTTGQQELTSILAEHGFKQVPMETTELGEGNGYIMQFFKGDGSFSTVRGYTDGLITLDIHEYVGKDTEAKFTNQVLEKIAARVKNSLKCDKYKCLPAVERGAALDRYFPTTDNRIIEYDFDECKMEDQSPYQNIKIYHSPQFGNMLLLDDDPNLAESDLTYTHAITGYGHEDYKDKTVLILGGGDGGILHELLKENPKFITMVDIDQMVIDGAIKYLRGICYDSMDKLRGDNYEVLVEDCVPILKKYAEEGKTFDYVINDLTAIPVTTEPVGDQWDFLRLILDLSMKVLSPTGRYYTQGNGANCKDALAMYEKQLKKLSFSVDFTKETVCVPSYQELWIFYKIWKVECQS